MERKNKNFTGEEKQQKLSNFNAMIDFVSKTLPNGFSKRGSHQVSRVYFEAISVGITLALRTKPDLKANTCHLESIVKNPDFTKIISGKYHTHTPERICDRIEYIRDSILKGDKNKC